MPLVLPALLQSSNSTDDIHLTCEKFKQLEKISTPDRVEDLESSQHASQITPRELRLLPYQRDLITIKTHCKGPIKHWEVASKQPRKLLSVFSAHLASKLSNRAIKELCIDNDKIDKDSISSLCNWMDYYCRGMLKPTDAAPYEWHDRFAFWFVAQCWKVESVLIRLPLQLKADLEFIPLDTAIEALDAAKCFGRRFQALSIIDAALYRLVSFWVPDVWDLNMLCRHKVSERVLNRAIHRFFLLNRVKYPEPNDVPYFDRLHWTTRQRLIIAYGKNTANPLKRRTAINR